MRDYWPSCGWRLLDRDASGHLVVTDDFLRHLLARPELALVQLDNLKKREDLDYYARARVEARIAAITPTVLELRRQGIRDEDAERD